MTRKQKRLALIGTVGGVLFTAVLLVMFALRDEIVFFYSPSDILIENKAKPGERFRLGGLVKKGSIEKNGQLVSFVITDTDKELPVFFEGILPDLFREGQGVIAEGAMTGGMVFAADTVLAKHDENYMPKEVADTLKAKGMWQGEAKN
jgi:cytochrome c-type biogenesis protein CcmE